MASKLTSQQLAAAAQKRAATRAFNRANGVPTVRQQRAAARAAKAAAQGQTHAASAASAASASSTSSSSTWRPRPTAKAPLFSTPKPNLRDLKLVVLVALEDVVKATFQNPAARTQQARDAYDLYTKCKALALNNPNDHEAALALSKAAITLIKLVF